MLLSSALLILCGCIKNDIPYPTIQVKFLTMEAEGQKSPAYINDEDQVVTLYLDENVDLSTVMIS